MPVDPERLQAIFLQAIEINDPGAQAEAVNRLCGDDAALKQRVEELLAAHAAPEPLPGGPTHRADPATTHLLPEAKPSAMIAGRYKLLEPIGEGGMGVVWMAEQRTPVRRLVALKLIKAGMDSRAVMARFDAERQALAMMDHPSIARVLDGGTTEGGHPWFAMELVRGLPLTEYCDERRLTIAERLALFVQICSAAQHAHQKGIIHRDLKPSNVLVTELDGRPLPKVIDFGLAKALGGGTVLTDQTLFTSVGAAAGTPLYMAPEQVAINALDVDTRADVYALGVLLYELLTGTTPLERQRLADAAWEEVRRVIREEEPALPSLRISRSDALASLAATRHIEPAKLAGLVKGDLDWIVLKALEKDRNRRYESAAGLAADVERHLADEPVIAAPPSMTYRIRKFVVKHRRPVLAVGAVAASLVLGLVGTGVMTVRYRDASARAAAGEASERRAREVAESDSYAANLSAAQMSLGEGNYPDARRRLETCPAGQRGWEWGFLNEQAQSVVKQIQSQEMVYSDDGSRIVTVPSEGKIRFWTSAGEPLGPEQEAGRIVNDRWLITRSGTSLQIWDIASGSSSQPIPVAEDYATTESQFSPDHSRLLTWRSEGVVQQWDRNGQNLGQQIDFGAGCRAKYLKLDQLRIVTTMVDGSVRLWDLSGHPFSKKMDVGRGEINITVNKAGDRFLTYAEESSYVRLWNTRGEQLADLGVVKGRGYYEFSPDGKVVLVEYASAVQLWSSDGEPLGRQFEFENMPYTSYRLSDDGERLAALTSDGKLRFLDTRTGESLGPPARVSWDSNHSSPSRFSSFSADNSLVVFRPNEWEKRCYVITVNGGDIASKIGYDGHDLDDAALTPKGIALVVVSGGMVRLWSTTLKPLSEPVPVGEGTPSIKYSPDGTFMMVSTAQCHRLLDKNGKPLSKLIRRRRFANTEDFNWGKFATVSESSTQLWDMRGRRLGPPIPVSYFCVFDNYLIGHQGANTLLWDLDGRRRGERLRARAAEGDVDFLNSDGTLLSMRASRSVHLWSAGRPLGLFLPPTHSPLRIPEGPARVIFTKDKQHLLIISAWLTDLVILPLDRFGSPLEIPADDDERAYVLGIVRAEATDVILRRSVTPGVRVTNEGWIEISGTNEKATRRLPSQPAHIATFCLSHDGGRLVTGGGDDDRNVRVYDAQNLRELATLRASGRVTDLEFSPADTRLIVTLEDGSVEIWDSRPHAVRQAERDARWEERKRTRPWADAYVAALLDAETDVDPAAAITDDASLTPTQRFVAREVLTDRLAELAAIKEWENAEVEDGAVTVSE